MARKFQERTRNRRAKNLTLAEMLCPLSGSELKTELEKFRVEYEEEYGATDLTKRYTSTWPLEDQEWLLQYEPKRYFDGLPPFAKAFLKGKIELTAEEGRLDDIPECFLSLFVKKQMTLDEEAPSL